MNTIDTLSQHTLVGLELVGTAAFALSGVLGAMRKRMDVVGICVCGFLAAFGGGTLRDVLIDRRPFFWSEHQEVGSSPLTGDGYSLNTIYYSIPTALCQHT